MKNVQNIYNKLFILFLTSFFWSSGIFILLFLLKILFLIFANNSSSSFLWLHFPLFSYIFGRFCIFYFSFFFSYPVHDICHFILWFVQISLCTFSTFRFFTSSSHICKTSWKKLKLWMSLSCVLSFILSFLSSLCCTWRSSGTWNPSQQYHIVQSVNIWVNVRTAFRNVLTQTTVTMASNHYLPQTDFLSTVIVFDYD